MNFRKKFEEKRRVLNLMRISNRSGSHRGCTRMSTANSKEHEMAKASLCYDLLKEGYDVWTECIFSNGARCDLISFNTELGLWTIWEVMYSETDKELEEKVKKYPEGVDISKYRC